MSIVLLEPSIRHDLPEVKKNFKKNHFKKKEILADKGFMLPSLHIENISLARLSTVQTLDTSFTMLFHWLKRMPRRKVRLLDCLYRFVLDGVHSVNQEKLSLISGIPVRTVQRYLKEFQDCGLITKITFYKLQNVYIIPTIVYMKRFARRMTRYLTSCKEWLKKQALNIKLLVPKKISKEYSGGHIRKILLKESYFKKASLSIASTESETYVRAREGNALVARSRNEQKNRQRRVRMNFARLHGHVPSELLIIGELLQLTENGVIEFLQFSQPVRSEALGLLAQRAYRMQNKGEALGNPFAYFMLLCREIADSVNEQPNKSAVYAVRSALNIPRTTEHVVPDYSFEAMLAGLEDIHPKKSPTTSGDANTSSTHRSQSRSKSHISPTVPTNLKQPSSVGYTRQANKPSKYAPGLHELPGGTPLSSHPKADAARSALAQKLYDMATIFFGTKPLGNPEYCGDHPVNDFVKVEEHYQNNPEACVAAGGHNPWAKAAQAKGYPITDMFERRKSTWLKYISGDDQDTQNAEFVATDPEIVGV